MSSRVGLTKAMRMVYLQFIMYMVLCKLCKQMFFCFDHQKMWYILLVPSPQVNIPHKIKLKEFVQITYRGNNFIMSEELSLQYQYQL